MSQEVASSQYTAASEQDTARLGQLLARTLPPRATVALHGTLGAGKTRLVQAVAAACGVRPGEAVSPTFVLCQHYHGDRPIYHFDAYRIADEDEFLELGAEEYFEASGITFVEWADRVAGVMPNERLEIVIEVIGDAERQFTLTAYGAAYADVIDRAGDLTA